jgi:subtilase family protein
MTLRRCQMTGLLLLVVLATACDRGRPFEPALEARSASAAPSLLAPSGADPASRHLVVFVAERVPPDFAGRVRQLGGTVEVALDSIGVAEVMGLSEDAAAALAAAADVKAVEPDAFERPSDDGDPMEEDAADEALAPADATASPTSAQFYPRQWNMRAVFAPDAWATGTLLAVKVADSTNTHTAGRLITGIVYAADQGADVINVSRGSELDRSLSPGTVAAFERAVDYAFRRGALVVSVPFNDAADLDHNGDHVRMPCEAANAICGSATGPTASAGVNGPWENVDAIAPYSAFGRSAISVAAPGGAGTTAGFQTVWLPCTTTPTQTTVPPACRSHQSVARGIGTSWAAPHVAGLAALLVARLGHGNPALIRSLILQSADDLGEPGMDAYYGHGRINVARALDGVPSAPSRTP